MISTHLFIFNAINWWSFTIWNISFFLEKCELPFYETIIIWINVCCNERSTPIDSWPYGFKVSISNRWEIRCPEISVSEFGNILFINSTFFKNGPLPFPNISVIHLEGRREYWRVTVLRNFIFYTLGSSGNWHSCTMESKWEKYVVTLKSFITSSKIAFWCRICMTKMQSTIQIGIGEGNEKLFLAVLRIYLTRLFLCPDCLCLLLQFD